MSIHMEYTKKTVNQTLSDLKKVILKGAMRGVVSGFQESYDDGEVIAVQFTVRTPTADIPYQVPCRPQWIFEKLQEDHEGTNVRQDHDRAMRIAWRQTFDWIRATVGMVDQGQLKPQEAFFAFAISKNGDTLFESVEKAGYVGLLPEASLHELIEDAEFEEG